MVNVVKKMIRDLWKNKVQFGAIFIMMFLGVFIFSGISSEYHGLEVALNNYICLLYTSPSPRD